MKTATVYIFSAQDQIGTEERIVHAALQHCAQRSDLSVPSHAQPFQIVRTERGKPYFPNFPQLQFSVSHSGEYIVCGFSEEAIGIDLQKHTDFSKESLEKTKQHQQKLAKRFFHPKEADFVQADSFFRFFAVWTAKESYVKYTGQGMNRNFSKFCVLPQGLQDFAPDFVQEEIRWRACGVHFCYVPFRSSYSLCLCTKQECAVQVIDCSE